MLEFRTLGTIDLKRVDGATADSVSLSPKPLAILAYLCASHPRPQRRDTLVALFWPELDTPHARGALRQELYQLRRLLGPGLTVDKRGESVGVDERHLWCDVLAFDQAMAAQRFSAALEVWHGEFLPGLHIGGGEFERWVDDARDRLRARAITAAREVSRQSEKSGDLTTAIACARRVTDLAPYDEAAWQRFLLLLDRTGDRAGALNAYDAFRGRLRNELEVEPSPETARIVEQIRRREAAFETRPAEYAALQRVDRHALDRPMMTRRRWMLAGATIAVIGGLGVILPSRMLKRTPRWSPALIALTPTENRTGDPTLNALGERITDHLARGLIEPCFLMLTTGRRRGNVDGVVSTSMYLRDGLVEIQARLSERERGGPVLAVPSAVLMRVGGTETALDTLTARVLQAVAAHYDPRSAGPNAPSPFRMPSWEAYLEYLEGSELYGARRFEDAARHFSKAYAIDTAFVKAAIFTGIALAYAAQPARADSLVTAATRGRALADYERLLAAWLLAVLHGRQTEAYRAGKELAELTRHPVLVLIAGREEMAMGRPREALRNFRDLKDMGVGWWRNWSEIWETVAGANHVIGDHRAELALLRDARVRFPESLEVLRAEVRARAALGEEREVLDLIEQSLTLQSAPALSYPFGEVTPADVAWTGAQELDVHGHPQAGRRARTVALGWLRQLPSPSRQEKLLEARVLLESDSARQAYALLATLAPFHDIESAGLAGLVAAALGDTAAAGQTVRALEGLQNEYLAGRHLLWVAGIRAAMRQPDLAMNALRRAFAAGLPFSAEFHASPMLRPLAPRHDFQALLEPRG